ncbi:MAG: hypothetical protein WBW02_09015 [Candidatus Sulfotelmatobacter sp.]
MLTPDYVNHPDASPGLAFPRYGITSCLPVNRAQLHELLIIPENIAFG